MVLCNCLSRYDVVGIAQIHISITIMDIIKSKYVRIYVKDQFKTRTNIKPSDGYGLQIITALTNRTDLQPAEQSAKQQ